MKAKEYLGKAYRLDQRINSKLDQVASLNELATKATSTLSDMPKNPNKAISTMENTICKIIDLQDEINKDIDRLVDLKTQIVTTIKNIENYEYQTLLEKRYLCFYTWEQIAVDMDYSIQHIYRLRDKALLEVSKIDSKVIGNVSGCS
jgi:seryl-tRNA synthetase